MDQIELLNTLNRLLPAQFEEVLFQMQLPAAFMPPSTLPQSQRASELIRFAETHSDLQRLEAVIRKVASYRFSASDSRTSGGSPPNEGSPTHSNDRRPLKLFLSYSSEDEAFRYELVRHLSTLSRSGHVQIWHKGLTLAGEELREATRCALEDADLILLMISSDYLADEMLHWEWNRAIERRQQGTTRVIPILLRPADISGMPLEGLAPLPRDRRPISNQKSRDIAWNEIVHDLRLLTIELSPPKSVVQHGPAVQPATRVVPLNVRAVNAVDLSISHIVDRSGPRSLRVGFLLVALIALIGAQWYAQTASRLQLEAVVLVRSDDGTRYHALSDGASLNTGDEFRIGFQVDGDAYVALYNRTPAGRVVPVMPPKGGVPLRWPAAQPSVIPNDSWMRLNDEEGREQFLVVASRTPLPDGLLGPMLDPPTKGVELVAGPEVKDPRWNGQVLGTLEGQLAYYQSSAGSEPDVAWIWLSIDHRAYDRSIDASSPSLSNWSDQP